tara:strand:- start:280 stop:543 length:264 start_codon:yes stop_codon:yes gene_type:complete
MREENRMLERMLRVGWWEVIPHLSISEKIKNMIINDGFDENTSVGMFGIDTGEVYEIRVRLALSIDYNKIKGYSIEYDTHSNYAIAL